MVNPAIPSALAGVFFIWAIVMTVLYTKDDTSADTSADPSMPKSSSTSDVASMMTMKSAFDMENACAGAKIDAPNSDCMMEALDDGANVTVDVAATGPQAGANVTKGYQGEIDVGTVMPIVAAYYTKGLCPVNVHWHLGTEHYSAGEYDCESHDDDEHRALEAHTCGPSDIHRRRKLAGKARKGYQCNLYDDSDSKFTAPYEWKFCDGSMEIGQTYEVHWPHSAAGACGTPNQYQTPFYDGVFCNLPLEAFVTLGGQDIASAVGVQAQVFTIVNDEAYYYPDLIKGMIVEGEFGADMAIYTGSTTGTSRNNTMCSNYTPITWQVDRKCHMISASTFDKMCADMLSQRDDMSDDLYAHGSRVLVADDLAANNHQNLRV